MKIIKVLVLVNKTEVNIISNKVIKQKKLKCRFKIVSKKKALKKLIRINQNKEFFKAEYDNKDVDANFKEIRVVLDER